MINIIKRVSIFSIFVILIASCAQKQLTEESNVSIEEQFTNATELYNNGDYKGAFEIWSSLAKRGDAESSFKIAGMYDWGEGVSQSYNKSFKWYLAAAQRGHGEAQCIVANRREAGTGVPRSYDEAYKWSWLCSQNEQAPKDMRSDARSRLGIIWNVGVISSSQIKRIENDAKQWQPMPDLR